MKTKIIVFLAFICCSVFSLTAQERNITGTVSSADDDMPLPGVSIIVQGTTRGVTTDFDGNYSIKASQGEVLEYSFIGFTTQTVIVANQSKIDVIMETDTQALEEIVVVGYGTQKKTDLTSAIATIEPVDLKKTPAAQVVQGFQGKVAGVQISSKGSPGETPEINIRGLNSLYGNSAPLFVVDGMFYRNIDFLNASEIKDISILKDASASSIYGVRAANGVVLITTKSGSYERETEIEFTTRYGIQRAQNVLKMANAEQFTVFAYESGSQSEIASIEKAMQRFGRSRINPDIPNVNTDWYKEVLRDASTSSNDLQITGGSEKVAYSLGGNFFTQNGILNMKNSYKRYNLRAKADTKVKDWLTVGGSFLYSNSVKYDDEGSAWQLTYYAVPILPVFDNNFTNANPLPYSDAKELGYRNNQNPFALMDNSDKRGERRRTTAGFFTKFQIVPDKLNFKSKLSYNYRADNERILLLPYFVTDDYQRSLEKSSITNNNRVREDYVWDNVLTYTNSFNEHDLTLMAGTSYREEKQNFFGTKGNFYPGGTFDRNKENTWYISYTSEESRISYNSVNGKNDRGENFRFYGFSYFGRAAYKYKDRYLAYATLRAEGSNKYDETHVYLPSFGLGWIMSEESFMSNLSLVNYLKFRAGWGRLANDAVPASIPQNATPISTVFNDTRYSGFQFSTAADNISWEFTEELNIGITSTLFNNQLSLEADYFIKDTKNLVIPVLPLVGTETSFQNVGSVRNKGFEISGTWNGEINEDFGYTISGNLSTIDNEVTDLNGQPYINRGSAEFRQRLAVGEPINVFYGWDIDGVYQNDAEIAADPTAQAAIAEGTTIEPGYFRYKDLDGNNVLDANDRKYLGSPVPTYYFGATIGLKYKNWEFSTAFYGQGGNVILNRNRGEVIRTQGRNIDAELAINRWHGEGTSNTFPSSKGYRQLWNQRMSKFWLEEGDFIRVQNIQLAYNLKIKKLPEMRFNFTAERPFQWSKSFNGFNPEVGFKGIDLRTYPTPSTYSFGLSVKL